MPVFTDQEQERLYVEVKKFLFDNYEPTTIMATAIRMTTVDIYFRLQMHLPGDYYSPKDIAAWMLEAGFTTFTVGDLRTEWLMMKRNVPTQGA